MQKFVQMLVHMSESDETGDKRLEEVIRHLQPPPGVKPWHGGASVLGSLRGVSPEVACWKPYPDRHNIWELALHVAYWNYRVVARLSPDSAAAFERTPADWPAVPGVADDPSWKSDRRFVREWHNRLIDALRMFDGSRLDEPAGGSTTTTHADLITGALLHETYHAGQIQLMKRLARSHGL